MTYEDQKKKEKSINKQLALADLKEWLDKIPKEKRTKPEIVVGTKAYTPEQLVKEAEEGTENGNEFLEMVHKTKIEMLKRKAQE